MPAQFGSGGASTFTAIAGSGAANYLLNETVGWTVAGFFQPNVVDNNFHAIVTKVNNAFTVRPLGLYIGSSTFGGFSIPANCLILLGNSASTWGVWTTSALVLNHWYFFGATHKGSTTTSTNLYVYDLTSPAGLMATASHSPASQDTDTTSCIWDIANDTNNFKGNLRAMDFAAWTGAVPSSDLQALAYRTKEVDDIQPQNLVWWHQLEGSRKRGAPTSFALANRALGVWGGSWALSALNFNYTINRPPVAGAPLHRQDVVQLVMQAPASQPVTGSVNTLKKNVAGQNVTFVMVSPTTGLGLTGLTVSVLVTKDNNPQTAGGGTVTEKGNGQYNYTPTQAETNATDVGFLFTANGAVPDSADFHTAPVDANSLGEIDVAAFHGFTLGASDLGVSTQGLTWGTVGNGSSTTSVVVSTLNNPSGLGAFSGQLIGRTLVFLGATTTSSLQSAMANVTGSTAGATPITLTVSALPATPASGDTFVLL